MTALFVIFCRSWRSFKWIPWRRFWYYRCLRSWHPLPGDRYWRFETSRPTSWLVTVDVARLCPAKGLCLILKDAIKPNLFKLSMEHLPCPAVHFHNIAHGCNSLATTHKPSVGIIRLLRRFWGWPGAENSSILKPKLAYITRCGCDRSNSPCSRWTVMKTGWLKM